MRTIVYGALLACMALPALPVRADDASRLKAAREHLLDKQLVIAQGMAQVGQQWGQTLAKQVLDDFKARHAPGKS